MKAIYIDWKGNWLKNIKWYLIKFELNYNDLFIILIINSLIKN